MDDYLQDKPILQRLTRILNDKYAREEELCLILPSYNSAKRCREFIKRQIVNDESNNNNKRIRILQLCTSKPKNEIEMLFKVESKISVLFINKIFINLVKDYYLNAGEIISENLSSYIMNELFLIEKQNNTANVNTSLYYNTNNTNDESIDNYLFERFGNNSNLNIESNILQLKKRLSKKWDHHANHDEEEEGNIYDNNNINNNMDSYDNIFDDMTNNNNNNLNNNNNNFSFNLDSSLVPAEPIDSTISSISDNHNNNDDSDTISNNNNTMNNNNNNNTTFNNDLNYICNYNTDIFFFSSIKSIIYNIQNLLIKEKQSIRRISKMNNLLLNYKIVIFDDNDNIDDTLLKSINFFGNKNKIIIKVFKNCNELYDFLQDGNQVLYLYYNIISMNNMRIKNYKKIYEISDIFKFKVIINISLLNVKNINKIMNYSDFLIFDINYLLRVNYDDTDDQKRISNFSGLIINNNKNQSDLIIKTLDNEKDEMVWVKDIVKMNMLFNFKKMIRCDTLCYKLYEFVKNKIEGNINYMISTDMDELCNIIQIQVVTGEDKEEEGIKRIMNIFDLEKNITIKRCNSNSNNINIINYIDNEYEMNNLLNKL